MKKKERGGNNGVRVGMGSCGGGLSIAHLRPRDTVGRGVAAAGGWVVCAGPADCPRSPSPAWPPACHGACPTLGLRLPRAKPAWKDGVLARVANLSPPAPSPLLSCYLPAPMTGELFTR